jgi:hypothetical protein
MVKGGMGLPPGRVLKVGWVARCDLKSPACRRPVTVYRINIDNDAGLHAGAAFMFTFTGQIHVPKAARLRRTYVVSKLGYWALHTLV